MHVTCLNPIQDAVSWTDKPFSYYVHTIDRSLVCGFLDDDLSARHHVFRHVYLIIY